LSLHNKYRMGKIHNNVQAWEVFSKQKSCSSIKAKVKLYYYRQSVGQSVLVSDIHLGPANYVSPSLYNYFWTVAGLLMWAPSLTRSRVCSFQFLSGIPSTAFLRSESCANLGQPKLYSVDYMYNMEQLVIVERLLLVKHAGF
jgi:hypothetical protein